MAMILTALNIEFYCPSATLGSASESIELASHFDRDFLYEEQGSSLGPASRWLKELLRTNLGRIL